MTNECARDLNHPPPGQESQVSSGGLFKPSALPLQAHTQTDSALKCHYDEPSLGNLHDFDKIGTSDIKIKGQKGPVWQSLAGLV